MAQLGSALEWGSRGRKFKSSHPDHAGTQLKAVFFACRVRSRYFCVTLAPLARQSSRPLIHNVPRCRGGANAANHAYISAFACTRSSVARLLTNLLTQTASSRTLLVRGDFLSPLTRTERSSSSAQNHVSPVLFGFAGIIPSPPLPILRGFAYGVFKRQYSLLVGVFAN